MTRYNLGRRSILKGLGGSLMALPFLRSMPSRAEGMTAPKRLVVFFTGNEPGNRGLWSPGEPGALTKLAPIMSALEPVRAKLTMIGGLQIDQKKDDEHKGGHTGIGHVLTGRKIKGHGPEEYDFWATGVSIDQFIAQRQGCQALTLAVRPGGKVAGNARMSYLAEDQPVHPIEDPIAVFEKYFGGGGGDEQAATARRERRRSVLDFIGKDLSAAKTKLPTADADKLEAHLTAVRSIEKDLDSGAGQGCSTTAPKPLNYKLNENLPRAAYAQMDLLAQALHCGLTNVGSIQIGSAGGGNTPVWASEGLDIKMPEHDLAHAFNDSPDNPTYRHNRTAVEALYFKMYAYLLKQLDAMEDVDGKTVLDNTLVLYAKPLGFRHNVYNMLFMLGGGGNLMKSTGRFVDFPERPHNDLLTRICQLLGEDDVEAFGDKSYCKSPLAL